MTETTSETMAQTQTQKQTRIGESRWWSDHQSYSTPNIRKTTRLAKHLFDLVNSTLKYSHSFVLARLHDLLTVLG